MTSAGAAESVPIPSNSPSISSQSQAQLSAHVEAAVKARATAAPSSSKSKLSASTTTSSATVDPKVIGGTDTSITSAPWMAQLWYYDDKGTTSTADDASYFCGGTVIAPTKILTAGHCAKGLDWSANGVVMTGTDQQPTQNTDGTWNYHGGKFYGVLRQWVNPSYVVHQGAPDNDVAILTLQVPTSAKPLKVTTSTDTASYTAGTSAHVYGWGLTSGTGTALAQTLQTATLPIDADSKCSDPAVYGSTAYVSGHMVCAGNPATGSDTGTVATCSGDSGGPLVVGGKLVGVVSWGVNGCVASGAYSVFAKVKPYVAQINMRANDTDLNGDNKADLFVRTSGGTAYEYDSKGTTFAARTSWNNWSGLNVILQTDLNRDGFQDFVIRTTGGTIYWKHFVLNAAQTSGSWAKTQLFTGWSTRTSIITPGDVTGDGNPDILSSDTAGALYLYPGKGNGTFGTRVTINASGWTQYKQVIGHGDFNGDGLNDLLAFGKNNSVYLYKGTGSATKPFAARIQVRTGWTYTKLVTTGDLGSDGIADVLARDSSGVLWLYKGTGQATSGIFATRIRIGSNWNQYNVFG
jgi:secreted trypsin-like serine protease